MFEYTVATNFSETWREISRYGKKWRWLDYGNKLLIVSTQQSLFFRRKDCKNIPISRIRFATAGTTLKPRVPSYALPGGRHQNEQFVILRGPWRCSHKCQANSYIEVRTMTQAHSSLRHAVYVFSETINSSLQRHCRQLMQSAGEGTWCVTL